MFADETTAFVMKEKRNNSTLQELQEIIDQKKGWEKVLAMIRKSSFQIDIYRLNDAVISASDFIPVLDDVASKTKPTTMTMDECYQKINNLVTKFVKAETPIPAIALLSSLRSIASKYCSGESKLINLTELGHPMQSIAKKLGRQSEKDQLKKLCNLIDGILLELNEISDIDPKLKSKHIAWFMSYYSYCYLILDNYEKPIELYTQAIHILQSVHGKNARILQSAYDKNARIFCHPRVPQENSIGMQQFLFAMRQYEQYEATRY